MSTEAMPPLPEPTVEDHPMELWGQNVAADLFNAEQMHLYARTYAADLERRLQEAGRWISVDERMPDVDGQRCEVIAPGAAHGDLWPAVWSVENRNFEAGLGWFDLDEVTHWRPIPAAPSAAAAAGKEKA